MGLFYLVCTMLKEWILRETLSQVIKTDPQGKRLRRIQKKNRWWKYVQTDVNTSKVKNWTDVKKN